MTSAQQPPPQQNQTHGVGTASEIENLTGNIAMVGKETSGLIREAIAEPEQILENVTEKVTASDSVETIVKGPSNVLGVR